MANATQVLIQNQTLTTTASSVTFSSIPSTYTDLKIVMSIRSNAATVYNDLYMAFNSTSSGYSSTLLYGSNGGAASASNSGTTLPWSGKVTGANATSNSFSNCEVYISNYTAAYSKSVSVDAISENNNSDNNMGFTTELWTNTAAINFIVFTPVSGSFVSGSSFALYGIKNS